MSILDKCFRNRYLAGSFLCLLLIFGMFSFLSHSSTETEERLLASPDYNIDASEIPGGYRYTIVHQGDPISYYEALDRFRSGDRALMTVMTTILRHHHPDKAYDAVFWECHPVTSSSIHTQTFEFVVLEARTLSSRRFDMTAFEEQFRSIPHEANDAAISFVNLGRDATLVVPCPTENGSSRSHKYPQYMTHIASFHQEASDDHVFNLWRTIGDTFLRVLEEEPDRNRRFWLSTSGLGVSWLHVRIDTKPKYYNYVEYKIA